MLSLSREQVRSLDQIAVDRFGIPGIVLMENAARGAVDAMEKHLTAMGQQPFIGVIAGKGNNGGDGFAMARHLNLRDYGVEIVLLGEPDSYPREGDAGGNLAIAERMEHLRVVSVRTADALLEISEDFDLLVDAVLGTGISGDVRGFAREAIEVINEVSDQRPVFAVDIPSGLDCDTGKPLGAAVKADATATFAAMKKGFLEEGAAAYTGAVEVVDIGCPLVWE